MESARPVEIVGHVVFTRPQQLYRHADLFGDPRGFGHVVVGEAASESTAAAHLVDRYVASLQSESLRDHLQSRGRGLAGRPDLELPILEMRDAVLRLERSVRKERIGIW